MSAKKRFFFRKGQSGSGLLQMGSLKAVNVKYRLQTRGKMQTKVIT